MRSVSQSASIGLEMASARLARSATSVAGAHALGRESVKGAPTTSEAMRLYLTGELPKPVLRVQPPDIYHGEMGVSSTDLTTESIQQVTAVNAFKANLALLRTDDERTRKLLEVKA